MMADCEHDNLKIFSEEGENGNYKVVYLCKKCGRFLVSIVGDIQYFDFEFKLTTVAQLTAVIEPILAKRGLRIVSAADADRITAQKQAEEDAKRRILDAENQRDAVGRALDEYLASKSDRD